jgi:hypothetical protein
MTPFLQVPVAPLRDFVAAVDVTLRVPLPVSEGREAIGYIITLGIRCIPDDWRRLVALAIEDGDIDWDRSNAEEIDVQADVDPDILAEAELEGEGIWYRSGRIFYGSRA